MLRPLGEAWVKMTVPPSSAKSCGAMAQAAPLAQSMTMRCPSSERSGTALNRERMYSARSASLIGRPFSVVRCPLPVGDSRRRKISASMASSVASGSLYPSGPKSLMPLSCQGLCEAEMTTPAENLCARARKATAGVGMTPALSTVAPPATRPAVSAAAIQSEDSRVSCPIKTRGESPR